MKVLKPILIGAMALVWTAGSAVHAGEYFEAHKEVRRGEPKEDQALIYFFRPAMVGAAIKSWVFVDQEVAGVFRSKSYIYTYVAPGKHTVWAAAENVSAEEIEVEAGKTYYFQVSIKMGIMKARVKLKLLPEDSAKAKLGKCKKFTTLTEAGKSRGAEIASNRFGTAKKKLEKRKEKTE